MNSTLIAVVVEQYNKIVELESQVASLVKTNIELFSNHLVDEKRILDLETQVANLNEAVEAHAISGIGELNQYLMDNEIGIVGDMTAKAALDHIKDLKSRFTSLDEASNEILGDYLVAEERVRELEIKLNAKPDPPEPEDAYLSDFRVLKTAIEIVSYAMDSRSRDFESAICTETKRLIRSFTENVRLWDGLDDLEPYLWSSLGSREEHLVDREWKK